MSEQCLCETDQVVVLPCSGGSSCGQIANEVAVDLTRRGVGKIYCLAGIGAHVSGMVESARSAQRLIVIDGCSVACGRKIIEHAGLVATDYLDLVMEGIEKNHDFDLDARGVAKIAGRVRALLKAPPAG